MKKIYFLLPLLFGCVNTLVNQKTTETINRDDEIVNENCMNFSKVKVLQVISDGYALANECEDTDNRYCFGTTVLVSPQRNVDYYDDMFISLPKNKCFTQNGVYKYETKGGLDKTVPILELGYKYEPKSDEEFLKRIEEHKEDVRFMCKNELKYRKKDDKTNLKKCDCVADNIIEVIGALEKNKNIDNTKLDSIMIDKLIEKCGDLSNIK